MHPRIISEDDITCTIAVDNVYSLLNNNSFHGGLHARPSFLLSDHLVGGGVPLMNILLKEHVGSVNYISLHNQRRDRGANT